MGQITDDQFAALYDWADRERAIDRLERCAALDPGEAELRRGLNLDRLRRETREHNERA